MSANRRHGGHLVPDEVQFPPASGHAGYYDANGYSNQGYQEPHRVNPISSSYYYEQVATPPQASYNAQPDPYPPGKATRPMHGGYIEPSQAWPEQATQEKQSPSPESVKGRRKLRKGSRPSTEQGRHGADLVPAEQVDSISQVSYQAEFVSKTV